jgi:SAM-dependent methyltransferase
MKGPPVEVGLHGETERVTRDPSQAEEARIRAAYARRGDGWRYDWGTPPYVFTMQDLERRLLDALSRSKLWPLGSMRILDVGCGSGHWLRRLVDWGAQPEHVTGIDLLLDRLRSGTRLSPRRLGLSCASARTLPFRDASFDLVLQFMAFTSMLDSDFRRRVAHEMVRVLTPEGAILWYDFCVPNPRNPDLRPVSAPELKHLFPGCAVELDRVTLATPVTRLVAPRSWTLCALLNLVPPLRTHYLGVIRKG